MDKKIKIMRNFTKSAKVYDGCSHLQEKLENILLERFAGDRRAENLILDIGSGTGRLCRKISKLKPKASIYGFDIAWGMVEYSSAKLNKKDFLQADAECIPFKDKVFDAAVSTSVYQWVENLEKSFKEARRVLKKGGKFYFIFFGGRTLLELKKSFELSHKYFGIESSSHLQEFKPISGINKLLKKSKFKKIKLSSFFIEKNFNDIMDLLKFLKLGGASNVNLDETFGLGRKKIIFKMREFYKNLYIKKGKLPATFEVFIGTAEK